MVFIVSNERPASHDGNLALVFSKVLEFALPFTLADRQIGAIFELLSIAVNKFALIPAKNFLAVPAIDTLGSLVPKKYFSFDLPYQDRITRFIQERRLFRDFLLGPLRWVMSRAAFDAPMTTPCASLIGDMVTETSIKRPSLVRRSVSKWSML